MVFLSLSGVSPETKQLGFKILTCSVIRVWPMNLKIDYVLVSSLPTCLNNNFTIHTRDTLNQPPILTYVKSVLLLVPYEHHIRKKFNTCRFQIELTL